MKVAGLGVTNDGIRAVLIKVVEQDGQVFRCNNGHFKVLPPDKKMPVVFLPSTPSDHRSIKNVIGKLRRAGFLI